MGKRDISRRELVTGLTAAAAGSVLVGCSSQPAPEEGSETGGQETAEEELYGMVVFLKGSEFFNWAYKGMVDAAKRIGPHVKTELQGPAEWDASLEARAIDELVARDATGILATAGDATAMNSSINAAIEGGTPVVLFDSDAPESKRILFCSTDQYQAGYTAGEAMADWGVKQLIVSTFVGPSHLQRRVDGFTAALEEFAPDAEIVQVVNDEGKVDVAETEMTAVLEANPEIDGIFAAHGNPGPGAAAAVRNVDRVGEVQIMGFDFGLPNIELIEKGEMKATVLQNPYLMGFTSMLLIYGSVHENDVPDTNPEGIGHCVNSQINTGVQIGYEEDVEIYKNPPEF